MEDAFGGTQANQENKAKPNALGGTKKPYKTRKDGKLRKPSVARISKRGSCVDFPICHFQLVHTVPTTGYERLADIVQMACCYAAYPSHKTRYLVAVADDQIEDHVRVIWKMAKSCGVDGVEYHSVVNNADLVKTVASNDKLFRYVAQADVQMSYSEKYRVVNNHLNALSKKCRGREYKMVTQFKSDRGLAFFMSKFSPAGDLSGVPSQTPAYSISPPAPVASPPAPVASPPAPVASSALVAPASEASSAVVSGVAPASEAVTI